MITLIYGSWGSGKTTAVLNAIAKDTQSSLHTFLLVPEQEAVQSERATLRLLPPSAQLHLEVLNFSRLYNRVCREYGGLSYRYITKPIRHLLMWQNLRELSPLLEEYGALCGKDSSLGEIMLSAIGECKASGITPEQLERAAQKLAGDDPLGKRLRDLALIYASFDRLVAQNYSDSADDLARLYEILKTERFFKGANVYVDSFTSFTAVEHRILEKIFEQAENVTVTIPLTHPECKDISTAGIRDSMEKLIASAERHGGHRQIILRENHRATSPALAYLAQNIWRMDVSAGDGTVYPDGSIQMEICDTPYAEADATAAHILTLLREGVRCRDIVVLMRDPEKYRGILEPAFEKSNIPYFFSQKTDLCAMPPVKLLLSALRIKQYNWQKNDIISHVKTGLYDFPSRSVDLFEEYVDTWNIHGARFTDGDWTMNPDGFEERISERGKGILAAANEIRRSLTQTLEAFFIFLDAAKTVPELCQAVYRYFTDIRLEERLEYMADAELRFGNAKQAKELSALYGILLNTLADIAAAMPEESADTEEFSLILRTVFRQTDIGTIPTSVDEVTVGSAAMLRASNPKYCFLLGLCEGEFPAAVSDVGLFSSGDRSVLSDFGIELSSDADTRFSDELMYVQRAFATPSHRLYLLTSTAELNGKGRSPSLPFNRVRALFPELKPHRFSGSDLRYLTGAPKSAAAYLRTLGNTADGLSLKEALSDYLPHVKELSDAPVSDTECRIDPSTAASVLGTPIHFSSSRFESYVDCPFNYYCTYVLGLRKKKKGEFHSSSMGTFIHYILEQLLRFATTPNESGKLPDDEELVKKTQETVKQYVSRICPDELKQSGKLRHLYTRLERLSLLMVRNIVEEFSHSEFQPAFFELSTNGRDGNPPPMEFVLEDSARVSFSGIIDRVDLLKKDGEVYIRVVDYKTGSKVFSLEDVSHGINIQMLLYLFTLCRNANTPFSRALGLAENQTPTPAGVVYLTANIPVIQAEDYDSEAEVVKKASAALKRNGVLLNEEEILLAMNSEMSPQFLAGIRRNKDGVIVGNALMEREGFTKLYEQIRSTVETIAGEMRRGVADASPIPYKDPCEWCQMKPICRRIDQ
ncbi:MAG: exodeoxyribonuclease V subunit gamma [Clostridia bacterium]|nr:exodeoxyribonuclease V subunit gamma [Clostridia bacterium]